MATINKTGRPKHCDKNMQRMYIRKGTDNRKWIAIGFYCTICTKMIRNVDVTLHKRREELLNIQDSNSRTSNLNTIVLDIGYYYTKIGYAGEKKPRFILDSILYVDSNSKTFIQKAEQIEKSRKVQAQKQLLIGSEMDKIDIEAMEKYLEHVFEILEVDSKDKAIMVVEKSFKNNYAEFLDGRIEEINNSTLPEDIKIQLKKRKKIEHIEYSEYVSFPRRELATLLFDSFKIAKIYFSNGELLSLYASKTYTGLVLHVGGFSTRIVPIHEGFIITHAINVRNKGTNDVMKNLEDHINTKMDRDKFTEHTKYIKDKSVRLAIEDYCFVSLSLATEKNKWVDNDKLNKFVQLSDDVIVKLDEIRYSAPEVLFNKEQLSVQNRKGTLVEAVIESIQKCDIDLVKPLYNNIVLSGGGTLIEGFKERFEGDLQNALEEKGIEKIEFNINTTPDTLIYPWIGGSIISTMKMFTVRNLWVTKEEYQEKGALAVDRCI